MAALHSRLASAAGFTIVEVMIAMAIVMGGAMVTVQVFDSSRRLAIKNERREVAVHQAERVMSQAAAIDWTALGHATPPVRDAAANRPANAVTASGAFDFDQRVADNANEPFVYAGRPGVTLIAPAVATTPASWSDGQGRVTGRSQVFVTSAGASLQERRVTVIVTVDSAEEQIRPIVMSTLATNPKGT